MINLLDWTVPRKRHAQTKHTDTTAKEAADSAGKRKKKKVVEKLKRSACKRQENETSLWLGSGAPASRERHHCANAPRSTCYCE